MTDSDEAPPTATVMEMSSTYSQVVFVQVPKSYPPNTAIKCAYTVTSALQTHRRDWVGIFKVGWSSTREYYTFVWTDPIPDSSSKEPYPHVTFDAYYLPKEDGEFYQFCYVDSNGQVKGASTPFCFKSQSENSLEYSFESDLLVITTQEQVEQVEKIKEELQKEMEGQKEAAEILKSELDERLLEIRRLRETNADLSIEVNRLQQQLTESEKEKDLEKNQCAKQKETETEMIQQVQLFQSKKLEDLQREKEELQQSLSTLNEKNEKAIAAINHLKTEREELKGTIEVQEKKIALLNLRTGDLELYKEEKCRLQDRIQLLQVDLQSSQKENVKLSGELRELRARGEQIKELQNENQTLRRSLSHQEQQVEVQAQCGVLLHQLQEANAKLDFEKQVSEESRRRVEAVQRELQHARERLEKGAERLADMDHIKDKLESQLLQTRNAVEEQACIMEIARSENAELHQENMKLRDDIQALRAELQQIREAPPPVTLSLQNANPYSLSPTSPISQDPGISSLVFGDPFQSTDGSNTEVERVCRYCREVFPGISQAELDQHEQSHKVCPFCTLICDHMEQVAFEEHVYDHED